MAILDIKTRQTYLKELNFYTGEIDSKEGMLTRAAYKALQAKWFTRKNNKGELLDVDGLYGPNTDILLRSAYNCKDSKYFILEEFKCPCKGKYCTGYPAVVNSKLVTNLNSLRDNYNKPTTITCGLRCKKYNSLCGGVSNSGHLKGNSADIFVTGQSFTYNGRKQIVDYWNTLPNAYFSYCNGYMKYKGKNPTIYSSKTMGSACHIEIV